MDFPIELIAGIGSAVAGFLFKAQANAMDALRQTNEMHVQRMMTADQLANSAAERSSPIARKILAYIIVGTFVFGLAAFGIASIWRPEFVVSLVNDAPQKELLWGLFKWGGGQAVTEAHGFVLPPWSGWVVSVVIGFFFGTGAAKPAR